MERNLAREVENLAWILALFGLSCGTLGYSLSFSGPHVKNKLKQMISSFPPLSPDILFLEI